MSRRNRVRMTAASERRAMFEPTQRYIIWFDGQEWGEAYYNMHGFQTTRGIPHPGPSPESPVIGVHGPEGPLRYVRTLIKNANQAWREVDDPRTDL